MQPRAEAPGLIADFLLSLDGPVRSQEQDPHGPYLDLAGSIIPGRTDGEVLDTVSVEIPQSRQSRSEPALEVERSSESAGRITDLLRIPDGTVRLHEEDPDRET